MLRGNDGKDIFFSDHDRDAMLFLLQDGIKRFEHRIHAFCFMSNHIHLLVQVDEISLSKIMQNLTFRYSQKINRKYQKVGHVFQGRFKAILIQESTYFTRLLRYIHMNPVRANITSIPENYRWSSHNAYLNFEEMGWLTIDYGLSKFGTTREDAVFHFSSYMRKAVSLQEINELKRNFKDGQILGNDEFIKSIKDRNLIIRDSPLSLTIILKAACEILDIQEALLVSPSQSKRAVFARGVVAVIAMVTKKISNIQIAELMNRDGSSISRMLFKFSEMKKNSIEIQDIVDKVTQKAFELATLQV